MTETAPKTRKTATEKAQDALSAAEKTLAQKQGIVTRLQSDLQAAQARLVEAQQAREYAFAHPALRQEPVGALVQPDDAEQ